MPQGWILSHEVGGWWVGREGEATSAPRVRELAAAPQTHLPPAAGTNTLPSVTRQKPAREETRHRTPGNDQATLGTGASSGKG